jgi:glycosyltransferase involved in cell wall biosynthesis
MKKIKINSIIYLSFATIPSTAAHSVQIMKMCQAIAKLGFNLTLVANKHGFEEHIFDFYKINHFFNIKGIKLYNIRFFGRLLFLIRSFFFVRKNRSDLLYTRDIFNAFLATKLHLPFIYEIHEISITWLKKKLMKRVLVSDYTKKIIFISKSLKDKFDDDMISYCKCDCVLICHDGVSLEDESYEISRYNARKQLHLFNKGYIVGYVGSLFKGRGIEILLDLASMLPKITVIIVGGEGKYLKDLLKFINKSKLTNIILTGFVDHKKVPLYLKACDVLLMPYQKKVGHRQKNIESADYMSPLKLFEYMASGKPIISSDLPVIREVLKDRVNALLVEPDNVNEWSDAIELLRNEPKLAKEIGDQAKKDVKYYSWDNRVKRIMESLKVFSN